MKYKLSVLLFSNPIEFTVFSFTLKVFFIRYKIRCKLALYLLGWQSFLSVYLCVWWFSLFIDSLSLLLYNFPANLSYKDCQDVTNLNRIFSKSQLVIFYIKTKNLTEWDIRYVIFEKFFMIPYIRSYIIYCSYIF